MARFVGDQVVTSLIHESGSYANTSGNAVWIGLVTSSTIDENMNVTPLRFAGGGDRDVDLFVDGPADYTGEITFHPQDWKLLGFALGSILDVSGTTPGYTHTLSTINSNTGNRWTSGTINPFMSFTIQDEQKFNPTGLNFIRSLPGCVVNNWELTGGGGDILECTVSYVGQGPITYTSGTGVTLSQVTTIPYKWQDVQLHIPSGTVVNTLSDFSLSVNNNLDATHYLNGSREIYLPLPLNRDIELTATIAGDTELTGSFYRCYFLGGSTFNTMLRVEASGTRFVDIFMSGCKMMDMEVPTTPEGIQENTLTISVGNILGSVRDDNIEYYNIGSWT